MQDRAEEIAAHGVSPDGPSNTRPRLLPREARLFRRFHGRGFRAPIELAVPEDRGARLRRILVLGDLAALGAASAVASLFFTANRGIVSVPEELLAIALCAPLFFLLARVAGLYHLVDRHVDYGLADEIGPTFTTTGVWTFLLMVVSSGLEGVSLHIAWFAGFWALSFVLILGIRSLIRRLTRGAQWYRQRVMLVGDPTGIDRVLCRIRRHPEFGLDVSGALYRSPAGLRCYAFDQDGGRQELGHRSQQTPGDVLDLIAQAQVERVIVTGWSEDLHDRTELIRLLATCGVYVDIVSGEPDALLAGAAMHHLEGLSVMTIKPPRMNRTGRLAKRTLDIVGSGLGLMVGSPLIAWAALRIKLDSPGSAFFRQKRAGLDGRVFEILKFRTMVDDADEQRETLRDGSQPGKLFKLRDDPRITKFGRKIRRSSVDELPQLWNVLRGDMSLVGPRPLPLDEAPLAVDHFANRQHVRPGITGPWQTHGRSDIPFEDMVKLDYTYVSSWSMQEDLRLLIRTVGVVFASRGAY